MTKRKRRRSRNDGGTIDQRDGGRWRLRVSSSGRRATSGIFETEEEAVRGEARWKMPQLLSADAPDLVVELPPGVEADVTVGGVRFDPFGRVWGTIDGANNVVTYGYDAAGNLTCRAYPMGGGTQFCSNAGTTSGAGVVSYAYDAANQMTSMKDWLGNTTVLGYDQDGNLNSTTYPAATTMSAKATFDAADNLSTVSSGTAQWNVSDSFTYNGDNLQATVNSTTYGYDALNRLSSAPNLSGATVATGYDSLGNVTSTATAGGSTEYFGYGPGSQLCFTGTSTGTCAAPPTGATLYGNNATGGRCFATTAAYSSSVSCTSPPAATATTTCGYDQTGNLTCLTAPNATGATCAAPNPTYSSTFAYNGNGLRMSDTLAGQATQQFTWDQTGTVPRILEDGTNAYLYGPVGNPATGNAPLELIDLSNASTHFETSLPNFMQLEVTSTGGLDAIRIYSDNGNAHDQFGAFVTPFGYAGGYTDPTGLVYLVHRYYDPSTGQFLTVDPLLGITGQPYSYAGGDPVNNSDPSGLCLNSKGINVGGACSAAQLAAMHQQLLQTQAQSAAADAAAASCDSNPLSGSFWVGGNCLSGVVGGPSGGGTVTVGGVLKSVTTLAVADVVVVAGGAYVAGVAGSFFTAAGEVYASAVAEAAAGSLWGVSFPVDIAFAGIVMLGTALIPPLAVAAGLWWLSGQMSKSSLGSHACR